MKWQSQRRKVEALALQATLLSIQSDALKEALQDRAAKRIREPEILIWAFAAGVFWVANPAGKRLGRVQSLLKFASTTSYIFKMLGIPLPMRSPF